MNNPDDTTIKRSILLGARIRFSPSGAGVRNQAIARIIEQNLASAEAANGLTEQQLQNIVILGGRLQVLRLSDVRQGIASLKRSGRVLEIATGGKERCYALTYAAKIEVAQVINEAEKRTKDTIGELFRKASGGEDSYKRAFIRLLCKVFSNLSDVYVQVITSKHGDADLAEHRLLSAALEEVLKSESVPDTQAFRYGVDRFFRESTPQFDQIKWNMAQNFYIAKALGIDSSTDLLSSDIFRDAALYCDTNVLIAGLVPENRHHGSFKELAKACGAIGMCLKATHATMNELQGTITYHASLLQKVIDSIPDEMRSKVRSFLLEAYLIEKDAYPDLSLDTFLERFQTPLQTLRDSFGLTEEDDQWFDKGKADPETATVAKDLSRRYEEMRGRPKSPNAAIHDAMLLLWVARENTEGRTSWVVTLDVSLAEWNARQSTSSYKVVTLDAFLQWMTPVTSGSTDEDRLAEIFAVAIKYQLLPRDTFFQLRDFQVFAEMGIETKQLPVDDVEACIREIKQACPQLDPSKAEDREKIGQSIQRYFADPGTKYKRTIEELQTQSADLSKELAEEKRLHVDAEKCVKELETHSHEMSKQIGNGQNALANANLRIERLERSAQEQEKAARHKRLIGSALWRTLLALGMLVVVEVIIGCMVWQYGEGPNLFQKLTNAWPWLGLGFAIMAVLYPFFMGRERMRLLKWWKGDTD